VSTRGAAGSAFLYRATRARWPSTLVAFLYALHPLHVESVAWVAERKEVPGRQADAVAHLEAALRIRSDPEMRQALERLRASR
jgi:hypothetical protein